MNLLTQVKGEPAGRASTRRRSHPLPWHPVTRDPVAGTCPELSLGVSTLVRTLQAPDRLFLQPWRWLGSWVSSSRQGLLGQHFDMVPNGVAEPQPGDLFIFPLASGVPGWWGTHAGVYCGDGEIIHLEGSSGTSPSGIVAKHGKNHLLRTRGPAKVLRKKGGLDAASLQQRIREAMDQAVEYNAVTCNCIHFALTLLGLGQLTGAMVSPALQ